MRKIETLKDLLQLMIDSDIKIPWELVLQLSEFYEKELKGQKIMIMDIPTSIRSFNQQQKLELGIEIVAAMKASAYHTTIEDGRLMALEDTEMDRLAQLTPQEYSQLPDEDKERVQDMVIFERRCLHKQAFFVVDAALAKLEEMKENGANTRQNA